MIDLEQEFIEFLNDIKDYSNVCVDCGKELYSMDDWATVVCGEGFRCNDCENKFWTIPEED